MQGYTNILTESSYQTARHGLSEELAAAESAHRQAAFSAATGGDADATVALAVVTDIRARIANLDAAREQAKANDAGAKVHELQQARHAEAVNAGDAYAERERALHDIAALVDQLGKRMAEFTQWSRAGRSSVLGLLGANDPGYVTMADRLTDNHVVDWLAGALHRDGVIDLGTQWR